MDNSYNSAQAATAIRRPDVKKKLVVVGDGARPTMASTVYLTLTRASFLHRWMRKDVSFDCLRREPVPRGMFLTLCYICRAVIQLRHAMWTYIGVHSNSIRELRHTSNVRGKARGVRVMGYGRAGGIRSTTTAQLSRKRRHPHRLLHRLPR